MSLINPNESLASDIFGEDGKCWGAAARKVRDFITQQARQMRGSVPRRLPPMRKVAAHLGVSVATIQTVYRQLGAEGVIRTERNRASYVTPAQGTDENRLYHIGIDFLKANEDPDSSWSANLHGGMLQQTLHERRRIVFHGLPSEKLTRKHLAPDGLDSGLDGVILAMQDNILRWPSLKAAIPAVYNAPASLNATENFVTADVFGASVSLGRAFSQSGRKRVFTASHCDFDYALAGCVHAGLIAGYHSREVGCRSLGMLHLGSEEENNFSMLERLFRDSDQAPDAIYCLRDHTAMRILKILEQLKVRVPEQVSVVGGIGLPLMNTEFFAMTRVFQPLAEMGARLVTRLLGLLTPGKSSSPFPGIFLPCKIGGGKTTTAKENKILGIRG